MLNHPLFVALFLSSPIWLFIIGTVITLKLGEGETIFGRIGSAMQFLSIIFFFLNIILAIQGPSLWPVYFTFPVVMIWPMLLISCLIGIIKGVSFLNMGKNNSEFNFAHFFGIAAVITLVFVAIGVVGFIFLIIGSRFIELFNGIVYIG